MIGVVLTGALDDGTSGLMAVKQRGGVAVVQDPDDALVRGMPESALEYVEVDYRLPLREIPAALSRIAVMPADEEGAFAVPAGLELESRIVEAGMDIIYAPERPWEPSVYTCPECMGHLWEIRDGDLVRFRCRTGHAYTADSWLAEKSDTLESALWAAMNTLEESAAMAERLAGEARQRQHHRVAERFEERVQSSRQRAALIRDVLLNDSVFGRPEADLVMEGGGRV